MRAVFGLCVVAGLLLAWLFKSPLLYFGYTISGNTSALTAAARLGYSPAIHQQWQSNPTNSNPILFRAAEQGVGSAQIVLADYYQSKHKVTVAKHWLTKASTTDFNAVERLLKLYNKSKQWDLFDQLIADWVKRTDIDVDQRLRLNRFSKKSSETGLEWRVQRTNCLIDIQPIVSNVSELEGIDQLINEFSRDQRLQNLPICFRQSYLLRATECDGLLMASRQSRRRCQLRGISSTFAPDQFTHLIVVGDYLKSFVSNGVMWLSNRAPYTLFIHELAHFSGFVDEYQLSTRHANDHCQDLSSVPNLTEKQHQLHTWPAMTCRTIGKQAFKLSKQTTFLEYHDVDYIPPVYLALWQQQLAQRKTQLPAWLAVGRALQDSNKKGAKQWFDAFNSYYR